MIGQEVTIDVDMDDNRAEIVAKSTDALIGAYPDAVIASWEIIEPDEQIVFRIMGSVEGFDFAA